MTCRICLEEGDMIQPCDCRGTSAHVHEECLIKWLSMSGRSNCEICHYEYEFVEVEEDIRVCCPPWKFASAPDMSGTVISIGIIGHLVIMYSSTSWGNTTEDIFVYGNLLQGLMLILLHPKIHPREVIVYWKCCSSVCLLIASVVQKEWRFFTFEIVATFLLAVHTYAHLLTEYKQTVRYINIEHRSLNDETV